MEKDKITRWLMPERIQKLYGGCKSEYGEGRLFIIGVGESGTDCALHCRHIMEKRFNEDEKKVRILCIALDDIIKNAEYEGSVFKSGEVISIDPEKAVYRYLNAPEKLSRYASEWFDTGLKNYSSALPYYGLEKRQCGRLALFYELKAVIEKIDTAAKAFSCEDSPVEAVIAGNIGDAFYGGMFIDLAYIIRDRLKSLNIMVKLAAVMFTPDVFSGNAERYESYKANAVIAKRELDLFQIEKKPFSQKYSENYELNFNKPPFASCYIARMEKSYDYTMEKAAEKIMCAVEINSFKDAAADYILSYDMMNKYSEHKFRYLKYGISMEEAPFGKIVSLLCFKLFLILNDSLSQNSAGETRLGILSVKAAPNAEFLASKGGGISKLIFDGEINPCFSFKTLKEDPDGAYKFVGEWLSEVEKTMAKGSKLYSEEIFKLIVSESGNSGNDLSKGPYYARGILTKCIGALDKAIDKTKAANDVIRKPVNKTRLGERQARSNLKKTLLFFNKTAEQYVSIIKEYAENEYKIRTGEALLIFYERLRERLNNYLETGGGAYAEYFEHISLNRYGIIKDILNNGGSASCSYDAFEINNAVIETLDKLCGEIPKFALDKTFAASKIMELPADDETAFARCLCKIVKKYFDYILQKPYGEFCEYFGINDAVENSIRRNIASAEKNNSFTLNRIICPDSTGKSDVFDLRAEYRGVNYIWNGSHMNYITAVHRLTGGARLEDSENYGDWKRTCEIYMSSSLKKYGLEIFK